ncbi:MAG TPA: transporter substrate-binding domain-containing protein [Vicinamibacteria bacterium]|nr:transporter substrate-binding domain-containing protein [Vicinamibacteria bacterium]
MPRACLVLVLAATSLPGVPVLFAADLGAIKARGAIRVVVAADEAPETFDSKGGSRPGFERELVETFAHHQGLKVEVVSARSYPDRIPLLLADKGDVIVAIFDTPERRQQVAFTSEVMPTYTVSVTLSPKAAPKSLDELRREKVGVKRGTAPAEELPAAGVASPRSFGSSKEMIAALASGEVTALVMPISEFALAAKSERRLTAGTTVGATGSVAWAVRKEDVALRTALDEHLANVRKSASWNLLLVKYFGEQAPLVLGRRREPQ